MIDTKLTESVIAVSFGRLMSMVYKLKIPMKRENMLWTVYILCPEFHSVATEMEVFNLKVVYLYFD